jgi:hypothetical protein
VPNTNSFWTVLLSCSVLLPFTNALTVFGQGESYLRPEHKAIVDAWLKLRPDLRPATDADNTSKEGLAVTRKEGGCNYHPYSAAGDFKGDGREDFVTEIIQQKSHL